MKYGYFDDDAREYVIQTPKTPLPWINYLGSEAFFSLISNTAGGYSFYRDARLRRITRYRYNSCPGDQNGRYYYIKDGGSVWNPGWQPTQTELDFYECRHGLGYTVIIGEKNGLRAALECIVPVSGHCEMNRLTLRNLSDRPKAIGLFSLAEFCLWDAVDDAANFQRNYSIGEVEVDGSAIYHKTEYRERRNHYAVYAVNAPIDGFDTDRESFCGAYGSFANPETVKNGKSRDSFASGWSPIGSHHLSLELEPGGERSYIFTLGYIELKPEAKWEAPNIINKTPAKELLARFDTDAKFDAARAELAEYWSGLLSKFTLRSSEEKLDRMVNIWNQYQCMVTFNLSRSASFFESGIGRGMGFRDSCQDILGFVHIAPERARARLIDIASTQIEDGSAYHQYQPLTKKGNSAIGSGFNDDPLWLIAAVSAYIKETGDFDLLRESVPFDGELLNAATMLEHIKRSFDFTVRNRGPHGLPLIGHADWNDCLNLNCFSTEPGESFQTASASGKSDVAESVFIAGMFVLYGREYIDLCEALGLGDEAARAAGKVEAMREAVIKSGWDGQWFLRAYDAFGNPVGSQENDEGRIFIEPQGMCAMAGIGESEGYAQTALDSVRERLDTKYGVMLHQPAYTKYRPELGEITSYPPGYKENAGIFAHNNPWIVCAEATIGRGERAFEVYMKTSPAYTEELGDIHRAEPYVYCQMIAGKDAPRFGEAKNSWLTGTAAWNFVALSQYILGIRPTLDGLSIAPCLPARLKGFVVKRVYRGAIYNIRVDNSRGIQRGAAEIIVDGAPLNGSVIQPVLGKQEYDVLVRMR